VTFAAPTQAATTVTFSASGIYTLQLSAFDGEFTVTDTCVITVHHPNQAPLVNAGPNVMSPLSAAANLAGTAIDDGLPGPLTIQWIKLSGPGTVNFAAPGQAATTATFSAAGGYTLQLSAFDGEFTRTDTCVVTVQQANQPPVVNAGPDVSTLLTAAAHLAGTVTDDGMHVPLTIQWTKLSGPGTATFTAPTFPVTNASFSAPGSYTLQLSAFDGEFTVTDTVVVTVQQNQPPVVNAGPDVTILLPAAASLAGTVTDDGLPGPLTIQWSKLTGPGTVTFAPPDQAATTATFSASGSYTLQLSAFDGEFTITDTVVVTVQQNQPPVVNAGPDVTILLTASANLAGTVTDDGLPAGQLTIQWSKLSGPGGVTFAAPNQATTTATFSAAGGYTLQLSAFDGELTSTDTCVVMVQQPLLTVQRVIASSADDAEERPTSVTLTSGDLELVVDGSNTQVVGLRFTNLTIPAGANITSAYVQFTTDEATSTPTQLTIAGQASDNAPTFVSTAGNVSSRPRTAATVAWAPAAWTTVNEAGPNQRTPDLASIVQEIVSRPGWASGNAMVFVITGTGTRTAVAFDDSAALAPRLIVNYQ
jgi:CRISPR/Cas system-associated endoribonuclease Cas2